MLEQYTTAALDFVRANQDLAQPIVFALGFAESVALIAWAVPSSILLLAIGGLFGAQGTSIWALCLAGGLGACLGDLLSYTFGRYFKGDAVRYWPLSRKPELLSHGERFFGRWGVYGIVGSKFLGPVRSFVPIIAGVVGMRQVPFLIASALSSLMWATAYLAPSAFSIGFFFP